MKKILITGGAGFIGVNAAHYFSNNGWEVVVVDNLSRRGTESNLEWLKKNSHIEFHTVDLRDYQTLSQLVVEVRPDTLLNVAARCVGTSRGTD